MGAGGEDLQMSPEARRYLPYQTECKSKATSQIHSYFAQATAHGPHEPLVIVKRNRDIALAVIRLDHFLELLRRINHKD